MTIRCILLLVLLSSCNQNHSEKENAKDKRTIHEKQDSTLRARKIIENRDSLFLQHVLLEALRKAKTKIGDADFILEYDTPVVDTLLSVNIELIWKRHFSSDRQLLIRRISQLGTHINIYTYTNKSFKLRLSHFQNGISYIRDTIFDVNGDGKNDFVVHWYPSAGCCLANIYDVYLQQKDTFSKMYEFVNPYFSPTEKVIRGIEYGWPGHAGLYKFSWNGLKIDTIEYIYNDLSHKGRFIKTNKPHNTPSAKHGVILRKVPKEYLELEDIDWFYDF